MSLGPPPDKAKTNVLYTSIATFWSRKKVELQIKPAWIYVWEKRVTSQKVMVIPATPVDHYFPGVQTCGKVSVIPTRAGVIKIDPGKFRRL